MNASEYLSDISGMLIATGNAFGQVSKELELLEQRLDYLEELSVKVNTKTEQQKKVLLQIRDCITSLEGE